MSEYYLVDVKSISSKVPRSQFSEDELEMLARSILDAGGLLIPLLLKQTGAESYDVLAGDRQYYAAVKAREINPRQAETVNAFVVAEKSAQAAIQQFSVLYPEPHDRSPQRPPTDGIDQRLSNLESRLESALQEIKQSQKQDVQRLEQQIQTLQKQIPPKVEALEIFNSASSVELLQKLKSAGITGKNATKLITAIEMARAEEKFTSFTDIVKRTNGLGLPRMLAILDAWNHRV